MNQTISSKNYIKIYIYEVLDIYISDTIPDSFSVFNGTKTLVAKIQTFMT